jgi:hypothetical protein
MPVTTVVRRLVWDDHEVTDPDGDLLVAPGAEVRLHGLVGLDAGDGHRPVRIVHRSKIYG